MSCRNSMAPRPPFLSRFWVSCSWKGPAELRGLARQIFKP
jgi:hypothetical protein